MPVLQQNIFKLPGTVSESFSKVSDHSYVFFVQVSRSEQPNTAHILKLSSEVLIQIYRRVKCPRHQIAFALSCKAFAYIAQLVALRTDCKKHQKCSHIKFMRGLRSYMPAHLQVCHTCWRYLPRYHIWTDRGGRKITELKKVDWLWAVKDWMGGGRMCPRCQIPGDYDDDSGWLQCWPDVFVRVVMAAHKDVKV